MNVLPQTVPQSGRPPDAVARPRQAMTTSRSCSSRASSSLTPRWLDRRRQLGVPRDPGPRATPDVAHRDPAAGRAVRDVPVLPHRRLLHPRSLERKGARRFILDRVVRLLLPMLAFVVLLSPPIEYVDLDNVAGWPTPGSWAFVPEIWWPPAPGRPGSSASSSSSPLPTPSCARGVLGGSPAAALAPVSSGCYSRSRSPDRPSSSGPRRHSARRSGVWRWLRRLAGWSDSPSACSLPNAGGCPSSWAGRTSVDRLDRLVRQRRHLGAAAVSGMDLALFLGHGTWQSGLLSVVEESSS